MMGQQRTERDVLMDQERLVEILCPIEFRGPEREKSESRWLELGLWVSSTSRLPNGQLIVMFIAGTCYHHWLNPLSFNLAPQFSIGTRKGVHGPLPGSPPGLPPSWVEHEVPAQILPR